MNRITIITRSKIIVGSLAALAVLGAAGCSAPAAGLDRQPMPQAASHSPSATASHSPSATASHSPSATAGSSALKVSTTPSKVSRSSAPGGAELGQKVSDEDKATQVHMQFTNNTDEVLNLIAASRGGGTAHWETQPPKTIQPGQAGFASSYAATNARISLTYQGADDGVQFTLFAETYTAASNKVEGSASSSSYMVTANADSGYNPTYTYVMTPGQIFTKTGQPETFTVPGGVTQLRVTAIGGAGGAPDGVNAASGAQISGTINVTSGEVLTVGVGGSGSSSGDNSGGGWGMSVGSSSYRGGDGTAGSGGGGGATVVLDGSGNTVVVAGGGGGNGAGGTIQDPDGSGGEAGYHGGMVGQDGGPGPGIGGKAGANTTPQGQDVSQAGSANPGGGGGGVNGGQAGINGTIGGGGAGSSSDQGLTAPSVESAPIVFRAYTTPGEVVFTDATP